jgi:hypothetical protein
LCQLSPGRVFVVIPRCQYPGCDQQGHEDGDQDDQVNAAKRNGHPNATMGLTASLSMIPLRSCMREA